MSFDEYSTQSVLHKERQAGESDIIDRLDQTFTRRMACTGIAT
ncbi:hypothetical protein [Propionibacterium sp. oral taxon 192]|nr:hypothetical protein [Propionibacterium sp. oral taxon 192]